MFFFKSHSAISRALSPHLLPIVTMATKPQDEPTLCLCHSVSLETSEAQGLLDLPPPRTLNGELTGSPAADVVFDYPRTSVIHDLE